MLTKQLFFIVLRLADENQICITSPPLDAGVALSSRADDHHMCQKKVFVFCVLKQNTFDRNRTCIFNDTIPCISEYCIMLQECFTAIA